MKKLLALLLALSLLLSLAACGAAAEPEPEPAPEVTEPEPEPEMPDPRALWETADAMAAAYSSLEYNADTTLTAQFGRTLQSHQTSSRFRARDRDSRLAQYQIVITGDSNREYYYSGSTAYVKDDYGQLKCLMPYDDFRAYLNEGSVNILPEYFDAITLTDAEDGYTLEFSEPRPAFQEHLASCMEAGYTIHPDSLKASGTIRLDEDGHYQTIYAEISFTEQVPGGEDVSVSITNKCRYISHDEEVVITLPETLSDYLRIEDLRLVEKLQAAARRLQTVTAADFSETLTFDGVISGAPVVYEEHWRDRFRLEQDGPSILDYYENTWTYSLFGEEHSDGYTLEFREGVQHCTDQDGTTEDTPYAQEEYITSTLTDCYWLMHEYMPIYAYWDMTSEQNGSETVVYCHISGDVIYSLFDMMLQNIDAFAEVDLYDAVDWDPTEYDGKLVLDEDTGLLQSVAFSITAQFTMPDGSEISGSLYYEKVFSAFDKDVRLPLSTIGKGA